MVLLVLFFILEATSYCLVVRAKCLYCTKIYFDSCALKKRSQKTTSLVNLPCSNKKQKKTPNTWGWVCRVLDVRGYESVLYHSQLLVEDSKRHKSGTSGMRRQFWAERALSILSKSAIAGFGSENGGLGWVGGKQHVENKHTSVVAPLYEINELCEFNWANKSSSQKMHFSESGWVSYLSRCFFTKHVF